ncbi:MAG: hypothetical protein ACE5JZ_08640 [Kiloniellales bacterium]
MRSKKPVANWQEAIPGVLAVVMATVFLGFMAVDIGSIPLLIITVVVLAMVIVDLVQTARRRDNDSQ